MLGDADSYAPLRNGFDAVANEKIWVGNQYGYLNRSEWPVFMVFPNGFALWKAPVLCIAVNGANLTTESTNLVVRNLDPDGAYRVYIGEDVYSDWTHSGDELTITTPALSSDALKIRVVEVQ